MPCRTKCSKCGLQFDRFSGKLINISDEGLKEFYSTPFIQEYLKDPLHKHPTLCSDCLKSELGRELKMSDIKFKNGKWMTSNVAYLIMNSALDNTRKEELIEHLRAIDKSGVLPIKHDKLGDLAILKFIKQ